MIQNRIKDFQVTFERNLEKALEEHFQYLFFEASLKEDLIYALMGGKHIRPFLLELSYEAIRGKVMPEDYAIFAYALECIHAYSLIHDDLPAMDNDQYRRGRLTNHMKFGEDRAILAGDSLLNLAFEFILDSIHLTDGEESKYRASAGRILSIKAGSLGMIAGQVLDMKSNKLDQKGLINMVHLKTCGLIEAATSMGAILARASEEEILHMETFGYYIGLAFQAKDDLMDIKKDKREGKVTIISHLKPKEAEDYIIDLTKKAIMEIKDLPHKAQLEEFAKLLMERKR